MGSAHITSYPAHDARADARIAEERAAVIKAEKTGFIGPEASARAMARWKERIRTFRETGNAAP